MNIPYVMIQYLWLMFAEIIRTTTPRYNVTHDVIMVHIYPTE